MLIEDSYNSVKSRNNLLDQKRSHLRGRCLSKTATIVSNLTTTCWISTRKMLLEDSYKTAKSRNNLLDQKRSHLGGRCLSKTATKLPNLGTTCLIKKDAIYEEDAYRRQLQNCQISEQLAGSNKKPSRTKMRIEDSYNSVKSRSQKVCRAESK